MKSHVNRLGLLFDSPPATSPPPPPAGPDGDAHQLAPDAAEQFIHRGRVPGGASNRRTVSFESGRGSLARGPGTFRDPSLGASGGRGGLGPLMQV